jgi:hypothetical protein
VRRAKAVVGKLRNRSGATNNMTTRRCAVATLSETFAAMSPIGQTVTTSNARRA